MKKLLIAASALAFLAAAPLTAQAATSSSTPHHAKHATVRHHTAMKHGSTMQAKKNVSPPSSTGSVR